MKKQLLYFSIATQFVIVACNTKLQKNTTNNNDTIKTTDSINTIPPSLNEASDPSVDPYQSALDSIIEGEIPVWILNSPKAKIDISQLRTKGFTGFISMSVDSFLDLPEGKKSGYTFLNGIQRYTYLKPTFKGDSSAYLSALNMFGADYAYCIASLKPINEFTPIIICHVVTSYPSIYLVSLDKNNNMTDRIIAADNNNLVDVILAGDVIQTLVTDKKITKINYKVSTFENQEKIRIDSIAYTITIDSKGKFIEKKEAKKQFNLKNQEEAFVFFEKHQ